MNIKRQKKVAVLMATHNGINWIDEQIKSILNQFNVDVTIFVSDDNSGDGTFTYLQLLAKKNKRIVLLPKTKFLGSAAKNFYRLICDVNFKGFDYISLSDQDDYWYKDKLFNHINLLEKSGATAVSSNVIAFWPNGYEVLIKKAQAQRKYDFLFEGPGPGCSFLLSPWLIHKVKYHILSNKFAPQLELHDWLIYSICRAYKKLWIIDSKPSLRYRQHDSNVLGANFGIRAAMVRFDRIFNGWYRHQVNLTCKISHSISRSKRIYIFKKLVQKKTIYSQIKLLPFAFEGRRKISDRLVLVACILFFIF